MSKGIWPLVIDENAWELVRRVIKQNRRQTWPQLDKDDLSIGWNENVRRFPVRKRSEFCLLKLLADARGRLVDYATIGEECLANDAASNDSIHQLKLRLVKTLKSFEMADLAARIVLDNQTARLDL